MLIFERRATLWEVEVGERGFQLGLVERLPKGGWGSAGRKHAFPRGAGGLDALVATILESDVANSSGPGS